MSRIVIAAIFGALFSAFLSPGRAPIRSGENLEKYFKEAGVTGSFLLYDLARDEYHIYNENRIDSAFVPASTFKIFNSLVALETGVVRYVDEKIAWDGVNRGWDQWNRDHTMRSAIEVSAVWFYQELARRIGENRMQQFLKKAAYGNQNTGGGIDQFWLSGDLRISPRQQIDFLVRLYKGDLPFSKKTMDAVRDILILEETDAYTLRGKTGWSNSFTPNVGWFVGYVESGGNRYFFANNIDIVEDADAAQRIAITRRILADLDILPESPGPEDPEKK